MLETPGTPLHGKRVSPALLGWAVGALAEGWGIRAETGQPPLTHAIITSAETVDLEQNDLVTFRFRVYWEQCPGIPPAESVPYVIGLNWEGHVICDRPHANEISA